MRHRKLFTIVTVISIAVLGLSALLQFASTVTAQDAPSVDATSAASQSTVGNTLYLPLVAADATQVEVMAGLGTSSRAESQPQPDVGERNSYIVIMDLKPMIAYEGDMSGYALTKPAKGGKLNPNSVEAQRYAQFLQQSHDNALRAVGASADSKVNEYFYAINGFSAALTTNQAVEMAKQPGVVSVRADEMRYKMTDNTPTFLGLNTRGGPWTRGINGEGVIVGIIDTGIWPEHPSFADDGSYDPLALNLEDTAENPACNMGNTTHNANDAPFTCNNKLLGARQSLATYRAFIGADPDEFDSARDDDGHGTHTASTAAGNENVRASIFDIRRGNVSGIAPRARIIAYKGLGKQGGFSSDLAAAIDQAVADGVDVINYSIGSSSAAVGADDVAFLFAADVGVFVATSAGNSGPDPATIGSPAAVPWLTSVGASTQSRAFISDIRLRGPGRPPEDVWGGSITTGVRNFNLVDAEGIADTEGDTSGMCLNPFPANTFRADDVVLCNQYDFGVARTDRVTNVKNAGGGAVIFHNSPNVSVMPTDNHPLPTVHVLNDVGQPLKDYLVANPGRVKISFTQGRARYAEDDERVIPYAMASFSSRGPNPLSFDIIKPDVTAPGVNILAGASPIHNGTGAQGQLFQSIMGTSMSSPHVAGLFALLKQAHPDWTPAMAKSALMTTANQDVVKHDFVTPADPFDMGAGHVNVGGKDRKGSAFEPGLAYDAGLFEYAAFTCGQDIGVFSPGSCNFLASLGIPFDASDLNLPSIGIADLAGAQTVVRTVTSVAKEQGWRTYNVSVKAPPGYKVTVEPSSIRLKPGDTATYAVTIVNESATVGEWRFGSLKWRDKGEHYEVYSPIAVRASLFDAPAQVDASGESGSASFDMSFGYSGAYAAAAHGLEPATVTSDVVAQDPDQNFDPADGFSKLHQFNLSGAAHFRIAMPPEAVADPNIDIDIYVFDPDGNFAAASTNGGTDELIDITAPQDGAWSVYVHGWQTVGSSAAYDMYSWIISATPGGNLIIDSAPAAATIGQIGTVNISWNGATAGQWHLGAVSHTGDAGLMGLTLVNVDNR